MVLSTEQCMKIKSVISVPPWLLLQFLPLGSSLEFLPRLLQIKDCDGKYKMILTLFFQSCFLSWCFITSPKCVIKKEIDTGHVGCCYDTHDCVLWKFQTFNNSLKILLRPLNILNYKSMTLIIWDRRSHCN